MTPKQAKGAPTKNRPIWRKPSPELVERFNAALPAHPDAKPRKMFGYPACFVNGHFFVGLHNENAVVRLPGDLKGRFPELASAAVFDPMGTGKGMKDWWVIPAPLIGNTQRLTEFLASTFAEVRALPPKATKTKVTSQKRKEKR